MLPLSLDCPSLIAPSILSNVNQQHFPTSTSIFKDQYAAKHLSYLHDILKIVLIIVNINKDENKSLIQINSLLKMIFPISWRTILRR
jgi:hypothetical protein